MKTKMGTLLEKLSRMDVFEDPDFEKKPGDLPIVAFWRSCLTSFGANLSIIGDIETLVEIIRGIRFADRKFCEYLSHYSIKPTLQERVDEISKRICESTDADLYQEEVELTADILVFFAIEQPTA